MRNILLCLSLVSLIACKACGQVTFREATLITDAKNAVVEPNGVIVVDGDSELKISKCLEFKYDNSYKFHQIRVKKDGVKFEVQLPNFKLTTPGQYEITVALFDPDKGVFLDTFEGVLRNPGPGPDPKPPSPVPPDEFGNIGQRVATWSAGLAKRKELAAIYKAGAVRLKTDLQATVNIVTQDMKAQQLAVLGDAYASYSQFIEKLNGDLNSRWPMTKGTLADYCTAVALGLEAQ